MQPRSIQVFTVTFVASLLIGIVRTLLIPQSYYGFASPTLVHRIQFGSVLILFVMIILISFGRSRIAKNILIVMSVLGVPFIYKQLSGYMPPEQFALAIIQLALQFIGIAALFTESARTWFAR